MVMAKIKEAVPPRVLHPLLLVITHIGLASITTQFIAPYVSKSTAAFLSPSFSPWMLPFLALRLIEPLAAWYAGLDAIDATFLTILTHAPATHFLTTFHPSVALTSHAIILTKSAFDLALPLYLIRPASEKPHHHHHHHSHPRKIGSDPQTLIATSLLSTSLFTVLTALSQKFFLTEFAVTRFPQVESVVRAHKFSPAVMFSAMLPAGEALQRLVFVPAVRSGKTWDTLGQRLGLITALSTLRTVVALGGEGGFEGASGVAVAWGTIETVVSVILGWVASA